ncbi:uncharacterized protein LOC132703535 [Cylas formicarius]|uniref:uncharacterized protein LOC132703535 n=1 Tax=Cylas formicarius TaxID=197179 RepID=UPI002958AC30|nr:uncharacterized protein LOC132703535 [Cylas formicarius]
MIIMIPISKKAAFPIFFCCLLIVSSVMPKSLVKRDDTQFVCKDRVPCGWAVYNQITRNVDYFMKNTCECPQSLTCLKADEDISIQSYVYRCQQTEEESKAT